MWQNVSAFPKKRQKLPKNWKSCMKNGKSWLNKRLFPFFKIFRKEADLKCSFQLFSDFTDKVPAVQNRRGRNTGNLWSFFRFQ